MIKGVHTMFYSDKADELRVFLRDVIGFPAHDVGGGWLIFQLPEADMGVHPTGEGSSPNGTHDISFYCDDIQTTVAEMKEKGVEFVTEIKDEGFGFTTSFLMPGDLRVMLYQPKYDK